MKFLLILKLFLIVNSSVFAESKIVAAYLENWATDRPLAGNRQPFTIEQIDSSLLTDLYFAFAVFGYVSKQIDPKNPHLTGDFTIQPLEPHDVTDLYPKVLKLKQIAKSPLRLFLSIGGWNFNNPSDPQGNGQFTYQLFSKMVANPEHRKQFIDSTIEYAHRYGFDGIDIDWEYPGDLSRGGEEEDFENFKTFLKECSHAFAAANPRLALSYAAPPHIPFGLPKAYREDPSKYFRWLAECAVFLDRMTIMAYDYHTPYDLTQPTGVNAPLHRDTEAKSPYFIAQSIDNFLKNGVPADKILLGVPAFGHSYAGVSLDEANPASAGKPFTAAGAAGISTKHPGLLAYFEISDAIAEKRLTFAADPLTNTAVAYNKQEAIWVSFDTPETVQFKAALAKEKGLKGVILWAIDLDEYQWTPKFPLLRGVQ